MDCLTSRGLSPLSEASRAANGALRILIMTSSRLTAALQMLMVPIMALLVCGTFCRLNNVPSHEWLNREAGIHPPAERKRLANDKPEWVLVGNSMLNSRLDEEQLSEFTGIKARRVYLPASQSAVWFLILKQVVAASEAKPKFVSVFFRNMDLSWPDFRIRNQMQRESILVMEGPQQPEWLQVLGTRTGGEEGVVGSVRDRLDWLLPSRFLNINTRQSWQNRALRATRIGTRMNSTQRREEMNDRFGMAHLRHDLASDLDSSDNGDPAQDEVEAIGTYYNQASKKFDPSPNASFLPHMIALAKAHGWKMHFHRVKQRPFPDGTPQVDPPEVVTYMADLQAYLESQGCILTDEANDGSLTLDMYADGDHIQEAPAVRKQYLENFWKRVGPAMMGAQ